MPLPSNVASVSLNGTLAGGQEIFQTGFWLSGYAPASNADAQTAAGKIVAAFSANSTNLLKMLSTDCQAISITVRGYTPSSGKVAVSGTEPIVGGAGTGSATLPLQCCAVMTLRTAKSGRANRGRMYLPAVGADPLANHTLPTALLQTVVEDVANWFGAIDSDGSIGVVAVVSRSTGTANEVLAVDADYRYDVQRRRANRQPTGGRFGAVVLI